MRFSKAVVKYRVAILIVALALLVAGGARHGQYPHQL